MQLPVSQSLALFVKVIRKITKRLQDVQKAAISAELSLPTPPSTHGIAARKDDQRDHANEDDNMETDVVQDEAEASADATKLDKDRRVDETSERRAFKGKQREMISALDLSKWVISRLLQKLLVMHVTH